MPANTRVVQTVFLILCVSMLALQSGCGTSGKADAPASNPAAELRLDLSAPSGFTSVVADGSSTVPIRIQVTNGLGVGLPGIAVTFATTAGTLSPSPVVRASRAFLRDDETAIPRQEGEERLTVLTDANGTAQVLLMPGTRAGTAIVTADVQGFRTNIVIDFVPGPASRVQLTASPTTVNAGGTSSLTATVTDINGNLVSGETVLFSFSTNTSSAALDPVSGVTDSNGQVTVMYTAGITPGADTVQARVTSTGATGSTSITVAVSQVASQVTSITVVAGAPSIAANGTSTVAIRATVSVSSGSLAGIPVTFATTAGNIVPATASTNATGEATVTLTAPGSLGTATVTASAAGFSATATVMFVAGPPATVQLSANPPTVSIGGVVMVRAMVTDATGNPAPGQTLVFSLSGDSGGSLSALSGVTDANGRVTVTYTASATPGTDTIQVRTTNNITQTLSITVTPLAGASRIDLLVSSAQLGSDGASSITLTALVRDAASNVVSGVLVSFRVDPPNSASIQVTSGTTGATGAATALLSTGGDPSNRTITVTATTGNLSSSQQVQVTGTTLSISGATALVLGAPPLQLSILLRDSDGNGIANQTVTLSSTLGNTLSAPTVMTNATGQATFTVTATEAGTDTIRASALGAMATAVLSISSANFAFIAPPQATEVNLNTLQAVTLHWDEAGVNQVGCTIDFFATRGNLTTDPTCPVNPVSTVTVLTNADGNATVNICSDNAGTTIISAVVTPGPGPLCLTSPSSQLSLEFVATMVDSLTLQAFPTTLGVNDPPAREDQRSVVTAIVRDARGNLVKDQRISFSVDDVSGGRIEPPEAVTDSFGRASATYIAGPAASAQDGVIVTASVGAVAGMVFLTVAQQPFFVTLGTGNVIQTPTDTTYALPYSVLVTDAQGNPVANATVELNVLPTRYQKGFYTQVFNSSGSCTGWGKALTIMGLADPDDADRACDSEDLNRNGVLDASEDLNNNGVLDAGEDRNNNGILDAAEDRNNNGALDPENPVTVPGSVVTDASGFAFFTVSYAREFTWVEVALQARTTVSGTEAASQAIFFLAGAASDFNNCLVAPPGATSPYGIATTCVCDESTDPNCPTVITAGSVLITPVSGSTVLPTDGGTFAFNITGGTQTSYTLALSPGSGTVDPAVVNFGDFFILTTTFAQNGTTIVITATDTVTGQAGTISLTQTN